MSPQVRRLRVMPTEPCPAGFTRRRFLAGLGVLAAAAAFAPALDRLRLGGVTSVEVERPGLGTWIRVVARHDDPVRAERAIERAFAAIAHVDRQMSVHRPDSQLSRVNRAAGRSAVAVDEAHLPALQKMMTECPGHAILWRK